MSNPPTRTHMSTAPAPPVAFERLLLTGAAGGLGRVLRPRLKRHCATLRVSDIAELDPAERDGVRLTGLVLR